MILGAILLLGVGEKPFRECSESALHRTSPVHITLDFYSRQSHSCLCKQNEKSDAKRNTK